MKYEGIFRGPRLWSNKELKKIAHLFQGSVVNVSAWRDLDKSIKSYGEYIRGDCNAGVPYRSYFVNAEKYSITNYPKDAGKGGPEAKTAADGPYESMIDLDLEEELPRDLVGKFDVVLSHTVLEHVFNVNKAFANLCSMSQDIVILVVPFVQMVHDFNGNYRDYWRFTPFALDRLFEANGYTVLYRAGSDLCQTSLYYFYVASRKPDNWSEHFHPEPLESQLENLNTGGRVFPLARLHLRFEMLLRRCANVLGLSHGGR